MDPIEAAILFLLRHVASHADGPTAKQAQKHLDAVEQVFAGAGPDPADEPYHAGDAPLAPPDPTDLD